VLQIRLVARIAGELEVMTDGAGCRCGRLVGQTGSSPIRPTAHRSALHLAARLTREELRRTTASCCAVGKVQRPAATCAVAGRLRPRPARSFLGCQAI